MFLLTPCQRLYHWFYNACRTTLTASKRDVINLVPRRAGKKHDYQAYLKLKKEEVGPVIKRRYREYKNTLSDGEEPMAFIKFQTNVAQELLAGEDESVKRQVAAYIEEESTPAAASETKLIEYVSMTIYRANITHYTRWQCPGHGAADAADRSPRARKSNRLEGHCFSRRVAPGTSTVFYGRVSLFILPFEH